MRRAHDRLPGGGAVLTVNGAGVGSGVLCTVWTTRAIHRSGSMDRSLGRNRRYQWHTLECAGVVPIDRLSWMLNGLDAE